jgi:hypothetical protein
MEQAVKEKVSEYFGIAERALRELSGGVDLIKAAIGTRKVPEEVGALTVLVKQAENLAWAFQNFPTFDINCLSRLEKREIVEGKARIEIFAPAFAWSENIRYPKMEWRFLGNEGRPQPFGTCHVYFDQEIVRKNADALPKGHDRWNSDTLRAKGPTIPTVVGRRVDEVSSRFDNVLIIWEAEWQPAPLRDPLVVGEIAKNFFLIDQFDVTKLERYILSEFCKSPKKK